MVQYFIASVEGIPRDKLGERIRPEEELDDYDLDICYYIRNKFVPELDKIIGAVYYNDVEHKLINTREWLYQWSRLVDLKKLYRW
jgi:DNA polymerase elongation subunit (family B)